MPIGTASVVYILAVSVVGAEILVLGMVTSDSVAAWIGMITTVSGGLLFIARSWREEWRRKYIQDMNERIQVLEEGNREIGRLRELERKRFEEAEKTFEVIRKRMMAEILALRATISGADVRDESGASH